MSRFLFKNVNVRHFTTKATSAPFTAKPLLTSYDNEFRHSCQLIIQQKRDELGLSIDDIANKLGYTNVYTSQLLLMQVPLNPERCNDLQNILNLDDNITNEMTKAPQRRYDNFIEQEPHVYRMLEAVKHNGESLKQIINEKFGDGIMSAIDFYVDVKKVKGIKNEDRVLITFNGKFLPFSEQNMDEIQ
mmetsp:Transcript_11395/g.14289  ORF Transcript_11395/g.14289 Transcript_11395/m.14289 type:complete len:188 (-) Transcript_11395:80-643(-)